MVFDGLEAVCWHVALTRDVSIARIRNISPGQLYTIILEQSSEGYNTFNWPELCVNAQPVNLEPYSKTIQNFVGDTGGILRANGPGSTNQEE